MAAIPTIAHAAELIAARKLSPVELTQSCLDRIGALNDTLHAFLLVTEQRALADARAAEARIMAGQPRGKLDGIPIAHKDIYNTAGIRTTAHSKLLQDNVPEADSTVVRRWAEAGTVLLGKLSTHEFAIGGPSFDLPWPPARNPWNPAHFTAGSSSGTGAAVAAGMVLGGTGSDTGGSIRGPSALCGLAGIKPTYGRVSRAGVLPLSFTLDHAGPMAWTVEDCALLLQAMAGFDPDDPASADRAVPDFSAGLRSGVRNLRIGVVRHFFTDDHRVSPATLNGIDAALALFGQMGAEVREVRLSPLDDWASCNITILTAEAYAVHEPWLKERFGDYGARMRDRLAPGALISASDYIQALRRRRILSQELAAAMAEVDILVSATASGEAPLIEAVPTWMPDRPSLTAPFNLTGYPAMSICTGYGEGGLPVAMQLIARPFQEATLLQAAAAYEQATPWRERRPALAGG